MLLADTYQVGIIDTIWPLVFIGIVTFLLVIFKDKIRGSVARKIIPLVLLVFMLVFEKALYINILTIFSKPFSETAEGLPLHLCSTSAILVMVYWFTRKKIVLEILFYQGIVGAIITFIFPDTPSTPLMYDYYRFFFSHAILFLTPIYMYVIEGFRPSKRTLKIAFIATHVWGVLALIVNLIYHTHYMYILPDNTQNLYAFLPIHNAIPLFAQFPMVIIFGEMLLVVVYFGVYYLFKFINTKAEKI